jgi:hypothetical protein
MIGCGLKKSYPIRAILVSSSLISAITGGRSWRTIFPCAFGKSLRNASTFCPRFFPTTTKSAALGSLVSWSLKRTFSISTNVYHSMVFILCPSIRLLKSDICLGCCISQKNIFNLMSKVLWKVPIGPTRFLKPV